MGYASTIPSSPRQNPPQTTPQTLPVIGGPPRIRPPYCSPGCLQVRGYAPSYFSRLFPRSVVLTAARSVQWDSTAIVQSDSTGDPSRHPTNPNARNGAEPSTRCSFEILVKVPNADAASTPEREQRCRAASYDLSWLRATVTAGVGSMTDNGQTSERRSISPKHVFDRSNMPSRWERLTGVSPKIAEDKPFLAFVAARYIGEERLPHPDTLMAPDEVRQRQAAGVFGRWACVTTAALAVIGLTAGQVLLLGIAASGLVVAMAAVILISVATAPAVLEFSTMKARCEKAQARLHSDSLDSEYRSVLNTMIDCDEGTLAYCAAKIASEIQRQVASHTASLEVVAVDLWDELESIGASAREIAEDREQTEILARSRLRDTREVQDTIASDKRLQEAAILLLAARVNAFADYRDRLHLLGSTAWRDGRIARRAMRLSSDELAADRLR